MNLSNDALEAFVLAARLGSFSAAARRLGKRQPTISEAIANLEIDLGVTLFDRAGREPRLTQAGLALLPRAEQQLSSQHELLRLAASLNAGHEPCVTLMVSDTWQSPQAEAALAELQQRFPDVDLEFLFGESADTLAQLERGRVDVGFVEAQPAYPATLEATPVGRSELGVYVASGHALAGKGRLTRQQLDGERELFLTHLEAPRERHGWAASSYLGLMELARYGLGWAVLPHWIVAQYGGSALVELDVAGWPHSVTVDLVWSRRRRLGPVAAWLIQRMGEGAG